LTGAPGLIGDAAGEHRGLPRGEKSAWGEVLFGFGLNSALWGCLFCWVADLAGFDLMATPDRLPKFFWAMTALGAVISLVTYVNRWRCIEAVTSRFHGSTRANLTVVPVLSLMYANKRGLLKFVGR
jgi:hypothetical protein